MSQTTELLLKIRQQGGEQLTRLLNSLKNLEQQSSATGVNFKEVSADLKNIQQTSVQSINNLRGYATAWREIANSVKIGSAEFKLASAEAAKLEGQLQKVQPSGKGRLAAGAQIAGTIAGAGVFGGIEGALGAGIGGIFGGVPGAITGGAIGAQAGMFRQMLGDVATYAADLSRQRQALQLVTKDASEYQRALAFIDRTSTELAIPQEILTRQFTQLTASVKGAGGNVRDAEKAFIGIASGIRGTGGSLEQLDSALTATSQVFSKGKVSAEELRQQIGERLPGAFSLFAQSIGKTPQELDKALEKGQVSLQDFQRFAEELFKQYGENAKVIADSPDAAGDRLKVSLSKLKETVGPILKDIGASFQNFAAEAIKSFIDLGKQLGEFGAQMEQQLGGKLLDNAIRNVKTQDAVIRRLEAEQAVRIGGLTKEERQQLSLARTLRTGSMKIIEGAKSGPAAPSTEPPSKLPGLLPSEDDTAKKAKKLAQVAQQNFNAKLQQLGIDLGNDQKKFLISELSTLEVNIQDALKANNKEEAQRLQLLQERVTLEVTETALLDEKEALEKLYTEGKAKGLDVQKVVNDLSRINVAIAQNQLDLKRQYTKELERETVLNEQIKKQVEEFMKQFQYNGEATAIPTLFQSYEDAITSLRDQMNDMFPEMLQLADSLGNSFGNLFGDLVFEAKSAKEALATFFDSIAKTFEDMVVKMIADYLQLQILEFFKNIFAPSPVSLSGNYFGGGASDVFTNPSFGIDSSGLTGPTSPFAMGGIMTSNGPLKLRRYASGGIASSPQMALYGEGSTPEAYVPLPDGRSIPVTMSGNGNAANVTVNVDASGSKVQGSSADANALGSAIGAAVQAELIRQKRPGGLLA